MPSFLILGARNLGGAIADRLLADGWTGACIARSDDTLRRTADRGAVAVRADVTDPAQLASALREVRDRLGGIDLIVNAVSVARFDPTVPFGGGALADADLDRFEAWAAAVARQAFVFFSETGRFVRGEQAPARIVQIGNAATLEAAPGMGLWAAGWHGVRALTDAARVELADVGAAVTLLAVIGPIASPKTQTMIAGLPPQRVNTQEAVAAAVADVAAEDHPPPQLVIGPGAR